MVNPLVTKTSSSPPGSTSQFFPPVRLGTLSGPTNNSIQKFLEQQANFSQFSSFFPVLFFQPIQCPFCYERKETQPLSATLCLEAGKAPCSFPPLNCSPSERPPCPLWLKSSARHHTHMQKDNFFSRTWWSVQWVTKAFPLFKHSLSRKSFL